MKNVQWDARSSREELLRKAQILAKIRHYFHDLDILEVQTPELYEFPVTDPYLDCFEVETQAGKRYLQTSPEYAMKRMLTHGSGSIYQICKAFRDDPIGQYHSYEFTMLEWYRVGLDDHQLMAEMLQLFQMLSPTIAHQKVSYQSLFEEHLSCNPHVASDFLLVQLLEKKVGKIPGLENPGRSDCLNLLFTHIIEPELAKQELVFIYGYPASEAALARIIPNKEGIEVARRFEVYLNGIELANGYYELNDVRIQEERFQKDLAVRRNEGKQQVSIDTKLLSAIEKGMPECAGVALGIDRLFLGLIS
ncbi:EF-P lysine aminoacylase EpmA [Francisellaceae bacterium]|nr:EF-P lysine aminoacylase EpmA [Francisellaceae bacterium]